MKRLAFLFALLVTGAVLAGACGTQPGGTHTNLVVRMGAGESDLDLDSLTLTGLDLRTAREVPSE